MSVRYDLKQCDTHLVRKLTQELKMPHFLVSILVSRGFKSKEEIEKFLTPDINRDWHNPLQIDGLQEVVERIEDAIKSDRRIAIFGDFDLDGISSTAILTRACRALGGHVTPFIPDRASEGYGISYNAYQRLKVAKPDLIVTVDCGIANGAEIEKIVAAGVEVVVTDHHEASDLLPHDIPICDPKYKGSKEDAILAGAGVALKVVQALGSRFGFPHLWHSYLDLATLGTIADMMPMIGQNRALVCAGLERIRTNTRPCIEALLEVTGTNPADITSSNIGFSLIPRLNAAGRMSDADVALNCLLSDSFEEAKEYAMRLDELNSKRKGIELELQEITFDKAQEVYEGQRSLVIAGEGWHEGVKGIVASHLVEKYGVPSILFSIDGDIAKGSGRSSGEINLFEAVDKESDLMIRHGGHKSAVGITIPTKNLPEFARRLEEALAAYPEEAFKKRVEIDTVVSLDELTLENVKLLEKIGPYGQNNTVPLLLAKNVTEFEGRAVGQNSNHFLCKLSNGQTKIPCINFNCKNIDKLLATNAVCNAIITVESECFRGITAVKAKAEEILPLSECPALSSLCSDETVEFIDDLFKKDDFRSISPQAGEPSRLDVNREHFEELASVNPEELEREIIRAIIGDGELHHTQRVILERLKNHQSTLGVMATGRGKSLIFQTFAALIALRDGQASIFVYPLRALMADQAFHITHAFEKFGLKCAVLNGETPQSERNNIYSCLKCGEVDIVLTTPEYLSFHVNEIAQSNRIGFLVVDEAHHIGQARAGQRTSYLQLGDITERLGHPVVLAVTATAPESVAQTIRETLPLTCEVMDEASRDNLHINDQRNIAHRDDYLAQLIASGGKSVIYVNSREQSVAVARRERQRVPQLAPYIGFYNAGLSREERKRVEDLFRAGEIQVLVATSAFGEGIDIPDIRNVILYHMPFNEVEFNQMAGRAGRDGKNAWVHLLYGKRDASINENILKDMTPEREIMAVVYRALCEMQNRTCDEVFDFTIDDMVSRLSRVKLRGKEFAVSSSAIGCGLSVFDELGLITRSSTFTDGVTVHKVSVASGESKVDLTDSARYCEGLSEISNFELFREWALNSTVEQLTYQVTHPITPNGGGE